MLAVLNEPFAAGGAHHLPELAAEAAAYAAAGFVVARDLSARQLQEKLLEHRPDVLVLGTHGDAPLHGQCTLAFVSEQQGGGLEVVEPATLARMLRAHTPRVLLLNGCRTEALGKAAVDAGVAHVACWRSIVADEPARVFGGAFARELAAGTAL